MAEERTPESLTRLEKAFMKRRACGWCEAPTHVNACYAMVGECSLDPLAKRCTDQELNERRALWLRSYRPRAVTHQPTEGAE